MIFRTKNALYSSIIVYMFTYLRIIDDDYYPNEEENVMEENVMEENVIEENLMEENVIEENVMEENVMEVNEGVDIYETRNAHIQAACNKYQLYSSDNQNNEYQGMKSSYETPIQVDEYNNKVCYPKSRLS